jgi:hypothetical protein
MGNKPPDPEVKLPLILLLFTLIITDGRPGDKKAKRTKAWEVGKSYSVALSSDFSHELIPNNAIPATIINKYLFIKCIF